jgi:hypothetical protein
LERLEELKNDPFPQGAAKLQGRDDTYRIRVGDYGILYEVLRKVWFSSRRSTIAVLSTALDVLDVHQKFIAPPPGHFTRVLADGLRLDWWPRLPPANQASLGKPLY